MGRVSHGVVFQLVGTLALGIAQVARFQHAATQTRGPRKTALCYLEHGERLNVNGGTCLKKKTLAHTAPLVRKMVAFGVEDVCHQVYIFLHRASWRRDQNPKRPFSWGGWQTMSMKQPCMKHSPLLVRQSTIVNAPQVFILSPIGDIIEVQLPSAAVSSHQQNGK